MEMLCKEIAGPIAVNIEGAQLILLGFGSTRGVIEDVSGSNANLKIGAIHFPQIWPFPNELLLALLEKAKGAHVLTVENNAGAQLAELIKLKTGLKIDASILKYDGRPFTIEELTGRIEDYWRNHGI